VISSTRSFTTRQGSDRIEPRRLRKGNVLRDVRRWRWLIAVLALTALVAGACGGDGDDENGGDTGGETEVEEFEAGTPMAEIQERGELIVGVKYDVPPFGFENPESGEIEGFDVDISQEIADRLGVELNPVEAISDNRIPFLQQGEVDLVASTMTITTDRDAEIDFSEPYFIATGRILVPSDSDIAGVDDLAGKRVCTATGSTYEATLKEQAPEAKLELVDSYSECFELVQNGAVDAVSTDDVILTGMIIQDETLKMVGEELTVEPYGIGIPDGETEMKEFVDGVLAELFESGRWTEIYDEWVGQYTGTEGEAPPTMTLEEALEMRPCEEFC
jgi:ABC-type amino acid transport substrate-binding protein